MKNIIALLPLIVALCCPHGAAVAADDSSAPLAPPVSVPPAAAALQAIAGDADSSAVPFDIGDVYAGPGVLAVGRLGSYRQFVVPAGHWVALAAQDGHSAHRRPVQMTGMAFGMLDAQGLRSIVTAVFNQRQGRPGNSGWEDAQRCEGEAADALHQWRGTAGLVRQCVLVKGFSALGPTGSWNRDLWGVVRERLQALGAPADRVAGLVTESYFTDHRGGYLRIDRYDFFGRAETAGPELLRARIDAAREYAGLAAAGFDGAFEWEDLKPGEPPPSHPLRPAR